HYGTTGCRMHLDIKAALGPGGGVYAIDPRVTAGEPTPAEFALMGDIAHVDGDTLDLSIALETHAPIERVDILNGSSLLSTVRPFDVDVSNRIRVIWEGAEYRGRGRTTYWQGAAHFDSARITAMQPINRWNLERAIDVVDGNRVQFDAVTTGNFGGCDIWLDTNASTLAIDTDLVSGQFALNDIGERDTVLDAGGLARRIRVFRLPETLSHCTLTHTETVGLQPGRDNPLWVRVTTEDGFVGWSSPIYVTRP
ncbi:MAG: DUF3604 domain-containing protein, partial [Pseudomonadota bacterium]